jgi:hypothetical protein
MTQYFSHELKGRQHRNAVALARGAALRVVVEVNQIGAKPLEKRAKSEMDLGRVALTGSLSLRQKFSKIPPIICEQSRSGCRLGGHCSSSPIDPSNNCGDIGFSASIEHPSRRKHAAPTRELPILRRASVRIINPATMNKR